MIEFNLSPVVITSYQCEQDNITILIMVIIVLVSLIMPIDLLNRVVRLGIFLFKQKVMLKEM